MIDAAHIWLNLTRLVIILLTALLVLATYRSYLILKEFQPPFNLLLSPPEFIARLVLVSLCLFLAWLSGLPAAQLGLVSRNPLQSLGLGLAIGLIIQLAVSGLTLGAIHYFGRQIYSPLVVRNILPRRPVEWLFVLVAFMPAVAMEELLFRALWLGVFSPVIPLPLLILGTSILFGFMHQPQGRLGVIVAAGINILFCLLFLWSGELLIPLVAHYTINSLQVIAAHYQRGRKNSVIWDYDLPDDRV